MAWGSGGAGTPPVAPRHRERHRETERDTQRVGKREQASEMAGTVTKKSENTWLVRIFLGRDPNGTTKHFNKTIHGSKKDAQKCLCKKTKQKMSKTFFFNRGHTRCRSSSFAPLRVKALGIGFKRERRWPESLTPGDSGFVLQHWRDFTFGDRLIAARSNTQNTILG